MPRFDLNKAIAQYADDNASQGAKVVDFPLKRRVELDCKYTGDTWEDGVPVTKMFNRNDEITLELDAGTRIRGVAYRGWNSDVPVLDFFLNGIWYSAQEWGAAELAEAMADPEVPLANEWPWGEALDD